MPIPFSFLLLVFVLAEIAVFILVGEMIGVAATLALTLLGMVAGTALVRRQGLATLFRIRADLEAGRPPARSLAEGAVLAAAALLLILPGFISDAVAILLFMPWVRGALWRKLGRRVEAGMAQTGSRRGRGAVVELDRGEYASTPRSDSPWRRDAEPPT
jgi:UPF0716 protein FxsA